MQLGLHYSEVEGFKVDRFKGFIDFLRRDLKENGFEGGK